jgi:hypothetical protein
MPGNEIFQLRKLVPTNRINWIRGLASCNKSYDQDMEAADLAAGELSLNCHPSCRCVAVTIVTSLLTSTKQFQATKKIFNQPIL